MFDIIRIRYPLRDPTPSLNNNTNSFSKVAKICTLDQEYFIRTSVVFQILPRRTKINLGGLCHALCEFFLLVFVKLVPGQQSKLSWFKILLCHDIQKDSTSNATNTNLISNWWYPAVTLLDLCWIDNMELSEWQD